MHLIGESAGPTGLMCQLKLHSTQALVPLAASRDWRKHLEGSRRGRHLGPFLPSAVLAQPCAFSGPMGIDSSGP